MKKFATIVFALAFAACLQAGAQTKWKAEVDSLVSVAPEYNEYNLRRRALFQVLPIKQTSIVFMGDSITNGCEWDELFDNPNAINRGISGDRVVWMFDRYEQIGESQPAKLFFLGGINDLVGGKTKSHDVVIMIAELLTRIHTMSPKTEIYLQSIFPMNLNAPQQEKRRGSTILQRIDNCNTWLEKWAKDKDWVTYIDIASALKDSEGMLNENLTFDGLHLNGAGYLVWQSVIDGYVNE